MTDTPVSTTTTVPAPARRGSWKTILVKLAFSIALVILLFELACQVVFWKMSRGWAALSEDPKHYYQRSTDPVLVYELKAGDDLVVDGRTLRINQFGIRDDDSAVPTTPRKIALLGDSVTFGMGQSQDQTLSALLQQALDPTRQNARVLNLGVPGYGLREILAFLKKIDATYHFNEVVYVLNANDFSWRDTIYEGADNGLYRMYRRPVLASPFLIGKAIYRYEKAQALTAKNEVMVSVPWYKWLYRGNRTRGLEVLRAMKEYCDHHGCKLTVLLLPAGCAYQNGKYELSNINDEIAARLTGLKMAALDPRELFMTRTSDYIDGTDHLTVEGNKILAAYLAQHLAAPSTKPTETP